MNAMTEVFFQHEVQRRTRYHLAGGALGRVAFDPRGDLENAGWSWHVWKDGLYEPLDAPPTQ